MIPQLNYKYAAFSLKIKKGIYCECGLCTQQYMAELKNGAMHIFVFQLYIGLLGCGADLPLEIKLSLNEMLISNQPKY